VWSGSRPAHTAWHRHLNGQTLHILDGRGLVQARGGEVIEVGPGDTIDTPPGEWHWHGAALDHFMTHLALSLDLADDQPGPVTEWGAHLVSDEYPGRFLPHIRDGGGDLVNISSVAGRTARAGNAAYAATKWGMNGWSEALRQELQPDIRVTVIEPGAVATELTNHITDSGVKQNTEQFYAQLAITAEDVAEVIAFAVTRPRRMTLNEILLRPTAQPG
jgi:hypothetical protein